MLLVVKRDLDFDKVKARKATQRLGNVVALYSTCL
jgi:hypothetical protein